MNSVKYIPGEGPMLPKIIFVGEAPGYEEDVQGRPFVGQSGTILNRWIEHLGLRREDCYITNAVKVRPEKNRTPTDEELKSWTELLRAELTFFDPFILRIAVGKSADKALEMGQIAHICIYHPGYILRNPGAETKVLAILDGLRTQLA